MRIGFLIAMAAALVAGTLTAPSAFAGSRSRAATAPTVVSATRKRALALPAPGSKTVQSIELTKGTWTVVAKASAVGTATGDFFRCELLDVTHATPIDGSTTFLNAAVPRDVITNLAVIKVQSSVTVRQECGHDSSAGNGGSIDPGANIVAFVTPPSRMRVARTTGATQLGDDTVVGVANLSLTAGTWVVVAKVPVVVLSSPAVIVDCSFAGQPSNRALGTTSGLHAVSTLLQVGSTPTLTATTTLTLSCSADESGAYLDSGVVLWAWRAQDLADVTSAAANACPLTLTGASANDALVLNQQSCDIGVGSYPSQLTGVHLPAGTWIALAGFYELAPGATNIVRCELLNASRGKPLDTASTSLNAATGGFVATGITNLAVVPVKAGLDVEGRCGEDDVTTDAQSVLSGWAFIKP